jgi:hypothetical protein
MGREQARPLRDAGLYLAVVKSGRGLEREKCCGPIRTARGG